MIVYGGGEGGAGRGKGEGERNEGRASSVFYTPGTHHEGHKDEWGQDLEDAPKGTPQLLLRNLLEHHEGVLCQRASRSRGG